MTHIFYKKCRKKNKKVIISSKKHFLFALCMFFGHFLFFLVDFCVLYLVCMLSDVFRRNCGPVYWVNISISIGRDRFVYILKAYSALSVCNAEQV